MTSVGLRLKTPQVNKCVWSSWTLFSWILTAGAQIWIQNTGILSCNRSKSQLHFVCCGSWIKDLLCNSSHMCWFWDNYNEDYSDQHVPRESKMGLYYSIDYRWSISSHSRFLEDVVPSSGYLITKADVSFTWIIKRNLPMMIWKLQLFIWKEKILPDLVADGTDEGKDQKYDLSPSWDEFPFHFLFGKAAVCCMRVLNGNQCDVCFKALFSSGRW